MLIPDSETACLGTGCHDFILGHSGKAKKCRKAPDWLVDNAPAPDDFGAKVAGDAWQSLWEQAVWNASTYMGLPALFV